MIMLNKLFGKKRTREDTVIEFKDSTQMDFDIYWILTWRWFQHQPDKLQFRTNENPLTQIWWINKFIIWH